MSRDYGDPMSRGAADAGSAHSGSPNRGSAKFGSANGDGAPGPGGDHTALREALTSFCERANGEKTVRKMLRDWKRNIHLQMTDASETWTVQIVDLTTGFREEAVEPRHMLITSIEDILIKIFTGRANPAAEYAAGRVKFNGSAKDEMKLDAIIDLIWR